jgi:hypothetical protein
MPRRIFAVLALLAVALPARAADWPGAWLQYTAAGTAELRAVTPPGLACPAMTADGKALNVTTRGVADTAYPLQVCVAAVPAGARKLAAGGLPAPSPVQALRRIVVVGDTGCRLKGGTIQDCNVPAAWPFDTVARLAARQRPDLVIHVGDYHYRETPCPANRPGCVATPAGDVWAVWKADFFDPAAPLLAVAPWLLVRGNHELCWRGGKGWFRLLDARTATDCVARTEPFAITIDRQQFLMLDSADADDQTAAVEPVAHYRTQFTSLLAQARPGAWLLTHRPVWALAQFPGVTPGTSGNATMQAAIQGLIPASLDMVLSGHVHDFTAYDFGPARPAQLVVGEGGSANDAIAQPLDPGVKIDGLAIRKVLGFADYGYLTLDRATVGWNGTVHGLDDAVLATCRFIGRTAECRLVNRGRT